MSENAQVKPSKKTDIVKVILAILAVLLGTYIFVDPGKPTYDFDPNAAHKIDSLQWVNDSLSADNLELDSLLENYSTVIDKLDERLNDLNKNKTELRDYYTRKIKELENRIMEPSDLDTFFMNRYEYNTSEE